MEVTRGHVDLTRDFPGSLSAEHEVDYQSITTRVNVEISGIGYRAGYYSALCQMSLSL